MTLRHVVQFSLVLCFVASSGCRKAVISESVPITPSEKSILDHNWRIARQLTEYDRYSSIATDSLLTYVKRPDSSSFHGYIALMGPVSAKVIFGNIESSCLVSNFEVSFSGNKILVNTHPNKKYCDKDEPYILFAALLKGLDANRASIDSTQFPYNSYVLRHGDTIAVYFMPGSTDGYYGFCGGLLTLVNANDLSLFGTRRLHQSAWITKPPKGATFLTTTSTITNIPNEVDLAQTLIYKDLLQTHAIVTRKYTFIFSWDKARKNLSMDVTNHSLENP